MRLDGHGLAADLPRGWEGRITLERDAEAIELAGLGAGLYPVAHLGSFPLPAERGDFGSGAVDVMHADDVFVALLEYGPDAVDTPLFARGEVPRRLRADAFTDRSLQRAIPGQVGWQTFFTHAGRAFCLYIVLGDGADAGQLAAEVEQVLATIRIEAR